MDGRVAAGIYSPRQGANRKCVQPHPHNSMDLNPLPLLLCVLHIYLLYCPTHLKNSNNHNSRRQTVAHQGIQLATIANTSLGTGCVRACRPHPDRIVVAYDTFARNVISLITYLTFGIPFPNFSMKMLWGEWTLVTNERSVHSYTAPLQEICGKSAWVGMQGLHVNFLLFTRPPLNPALPVPPEQCSQIPLLSKIGQIVTMFDFCSLSVLGYLCFCSMGPSFTPAWACSSCWSTPPQSKCVLRSWWSLTFTTKVPWYCLHC